SSPGAGQGGVTVACGGLAGYVWGTPVQLGQPIRIPAPPTSCTGRVGAARPASDASAKPAEMTTTLRTPADAHSSTTPSTAAAGTATTARSTGAPIAPMRG